MQQVDRAEVQFGFAAAHPPSAYDWHPEPKPEKSLRYQVILSGAAIEFPDGTQVCHPNPFRTTPERETSAADGPEAELPVLAMWQALSASEATFEHQRRRRFQGFKRDDRIVDEAGNWINSAAHWVCKSKKP